MPICIVMGEKNNTHLRAHLIVMFVDCFIHAFLKEGKLHDICKILVFTKREQIQMKKVIKIILTHASYRFSVMFVFPDEMFERTTYSEMEQKYPLKDYSFT